MKKKLLIIAIGLSLGLVIYAQVTRGTPSQLRVAVDAAGLLLISPETQTDPVNRVQFSNARLAVDANGQLLVSCADCGGGGGGAPTDATYITQVANSGLSAEQPIGALASGILRGATTSGVITSLGDILPTANGGSATLATVATTGNIIALASTTSVVRMNNATLSTIQGITAGIAGQKITIISVGAGNVMLAHQSGSATAANQLINTVTSGLTPLAAGKGIATLTYDGTSQRWRLTGHVQGDWINFPFSAGDWTTNGTMVWTIDTDNTTNSYYIQGKNLLWSITSVGEFSGTATDEVNIQLNGYTGESASKTLPVIAFNGTNRVVWGNFSGNELIFFNLDFGNWESPEAVEMSIYFTVNLD